MNEDETPTSQAWESVLKLVKEITIIVPILIVLFILVWKAYGIDKIKEISQVESLGFKIEQILSILKKSTDKKIIEEVMEESERYRPQR